MAVASAAASPAMAADPLGPAREGKAQCYTPDVARKTCQSIGGYRFEPAGGVIINTAEAMLAPSPLVVIRTEAPVTIRDGQICGHLTGVEQADVFVAGAPASAAVGDQIRAGYLQALAPFLGKEVCSTPAPGGGNGPSTATLDGVAVPAMTQTVLWIDPADGWRVGP